MSVVLLSPFFHPEPISTGRYNTVLAQELVRRGETVHVLASHPLYPEWRPSRSGEQLPGIRARRGGSWLRYPRAAVLRRLLLEIWYACFATTRLLGMRGEITRVVAVFPPNLFATTLRLILPRRVRLIGIVHDLQGVMARRQDSLAGRLLMRVVRAIERRALAGCDRLVFLSSSMAERAKSEYGIPPERCAVHYPFLTLQVQPATGTQTLASALPDGAIHLVYSGALGEKQDPDRLVEAMRVLADRVHGLCCHVFSAGPSFERLSKAAIHAGDGRVAFHPLVPEELLNDLYARSAVQLLPQAAGTSDGAMPSKLPNLLAAGVPVFAICDAHSEIVHLLRQAGGTAGDFVDSFDAANLHESFEALLERTRNESNAARGFRQRHLVRELFSAEAVANTVLNC